MRSDRKKAVAVGLCLTLALCIYPPWLGSSEEGGSSVRAGHAFAFSRPLKTTRAFAPSAHYSWLMRWVAGYWAEHPDGPPPTAAMADRGLGLDGNVSLVEPLLARINFYRRAGRWEPTGSWSEHRTPFAHASVDWALLGVEWLLVVALCAAHVLRSDHRSAPRLHSTRGSPA
jgi:hypothetical protein